MIPTYEEYLLFYGDLARVPQNAFNLVLYLAVTKINSYITVDILNLTDDFVLFCVLEVCHALYPSIQRDGVLSENTDGYSVSYDGKMPDIYDIIKKYLRKYLYRGVC